MLARPKLLLDPNYLLFLFKHCLIVLLYIKHILQMNLINSCSYLDWIPLFAVDNIFVNDCFKTRFIKNIHLATVKTDHCRYRQWTIYKFSSALQNDLLLANDFNDKKNTNYKYVFSFLFVVLFTCSSSCHCSILNFSTVLKIWIASCV